jgi:calcineurin-like phosphoesterase family protein
MTRNVWFTSDTHFGHNNIIQYCRPQFLNVDDMEQALIERWNATVGAQDLVYHLGDFAWKTEDAKRVRPLLNGTIRLIVGNHDDIPALAAAGLFQRIYLWRQFREIGLTASHIPMRLDQLRHGSKNLHGHVHGNLEGLEEFHRDVSVESTNFTPVHFDEIAAWAKD